MQTFILTIVLQLQQWRMEQTRSASTWQYRKRGACKGSGGCRKRAQHSNPCRGKQWFLRKNLVEKYHGVTAEGLVESALDKVKLIEDMGYDNLVISIKSSDVMMCVKRMN